MSASREKKQRQGAGPSEKALQAQQQQAARRQKTVIYTVIGVVIAALVAALLIWNTGFFQARATAATVGGTNLSVAELSYYYYSARMNEFYYYSVLGLATPSDSDVRDNATGQTYRDYFLEKALSDAQKSAAKADEARKNGHTETEVKDSLNAQVQRLKAQAAANSTSYSAYLKAMFGAYMSAGVFEKLFSQDLLADLASSDKYYELFDSYSEDDLWAYYNADDHADSLDTFEYSYLYFTPEAVDEKDADGNARDEDEVKADKEEALAKAKTNAEEALEAIKGSSISSLAKKYELADNRYGDHLAEVGAASASSVILDDLLAMKDGDAKLVENGESGYYVVTLHSRKLVEDPTKDVRHILALAETTTDKDGKIVAPTDEAWAAAKEKIEAIQAEYETGAKTEDSFAALANEKSDDGDGTTGGLYEGSYDGSFVPEFNEWVFDAGRQTGDVSGPIRHEGDPDSSNQYWGYHLIYYVGENEPVWMLETRDTLAGEDLDAWLEGLTANYKTALTGGADNIGR